MQALFHLAIFSLSIYSTVSNFGCTTKKIHVARAGGLKDLGGHKPGHALRSSNPIPLGTLYRLVSERKLDELRAVVKSTDLEIIRAELFYRDNLLRSPLTLAWQQKDGEMISFLLSLGKLSRVLVGVFPFSHPCDTARFDFRCQGRPNLYLSKAQLPKVFFAQFL